MLSMAEVQYYAQVRATVRKETETVDASTVAEVLSAIRKTYGKAAEKQAKASLIAVNDISINLLDGMKTRIGPDDTVSFLPVCGGG